MASPTPVPLPVAPRANPEEQLTSITASAAELGAFLAQLNVGLAPLLRWVPPPPPPPPASDVPKTANSAKLDPCITILVHATPLSEVNINAGSEGPMEISINGGAPIQLAPGQTIRAAGTITVHCMVTMPQPPAGSGKPAVPDNTKPGTVSWWPAK